MSEIIMARTTRDRRRALAFVRRHVRRLYGGIPPPSQILFLAQHSGRICGTMALDFAGPERLFPLEAIYQINYSRTPWPFERERIAQFSKWWTTRPGIAVRLMHAAHVHALSESKQFGLVEVKPRIVARVEEFGMSLVEVPGAVLQTQVVSLRGEGYYQTLPPPRLYMFDLNSNTAALVRYLATNP